MNQAPSEARTIPTKARSAAVVPAVALYLPFKRLLDIVFSVVLLTLLSPVFLIIGLALKLESRGPVFFLQQRLGRHGQRFGLYKFRTLSRRPSRGDEEGSVMALSGSDSDITRIGGFLRNSGLNELPQLINIMRGEMSFIGPRPAVLHHEQFYTDWHRARLEVLPGVTGLAQVCGRNVIPWGWRVTLDRYYIEHASFWLDLQILLKTAWVVGCGIGCEGEEDMYFNFDLPETDILAGLRRRGVFRTFLRKTAGDR